MTETKQRQFRAMVAMFRGGVIPLGRVYAIVHIPESDDVPEHTDAFFLCPHYRAPSAIVGDGG